MTFRSDLDALRARHDALEDEVAARRRELVETRRMIEEVQRRASLPVLDDIRVASPCSAEWARMAGDERVRACGDCNRNVYNLSGMTRDEAEVLIREAEGRLCVRYYRRADGTILFGDDCAVGVKRRRRRRVVAGAAALLAATGVAAYGASQRGAHVMGAIDPAARLDRSSMQIRAAQAALERIEAEQPIEQGPGASAGGPDGEGGLR